MKKLEKWKIIFICICLVFLVAVTADARRRTTSTSTPTPATAATATPIPAATVTPVSGATATPVSGGGGTEWVCGVYYAAGTVVTYLGNTYVALVGHTAYCGANWNPADTPSLWALSSSGGGGTVATSTPVQGNTATPVQANTATPVPAATATPTTPPSTGALWADEFNGSGLPAWNFDLGGGGWGNNELETYTNSTANCNQSGGYLNITALNSGGYTSSRIKSPYNRTYGRIEGRMKVPMGQGLWPAFWMLGTNIGSVGWPACGEIDIMEHINSEGTIYGTMHWDTGGYASYGGSVGCSPQNFNTYSIIWDSSAIRWLINGSQYWEGNIAGSINGTDEFHRNFFIILNLAVGGNWPGSPNSSTAFPAVFQIDYVRWYAN